MVEKVTVREAAQLFVDRGVARQQDGDLNGAIAAFTRAIQLDPTFFDAYNHRGHVYTDLHEYRRAIDDYSEALRLQPANAMTHFSRGTAYQLSGDPRLALDDFERTLACDPPDRLLAPLHLHLGILCATLGDKPRAEVHLTEVIHRDVANFSAYHNRAILREMRGDLRGAAADYRQVLSLRPDAPQARFWTAYVRFVEALEADLLARVESCAGDGAAQTALVEAVWPVVSRAAAGVRYDEDFADPLALLSRATTEQLVDNVHQMNAENETPTTA